MAESVAALPPTASQAVYFCGLDKSFMEGPTWSHLKSDVTQQRSRKPYGQLEEAMPVTSE